MSDKERLEEIKQTINHPNYTEHNGQEEIYFMVSDNDFNWLIQQAERVEELEKVEYALQETYRQEREYNKKLEEQNKRYRKVINNIIEKAMLFGTNEEVYEAIQDAIQVLEGKE